LAGKITNSGHCGKTVNAPAALEIPKKKPEPRVEVPAFLPRLNFKTRVSKKTWFINKDL